MIEENIKVEYLENTKTHKMGFTLDEIAEPGQPGWQVDYREYTSTFTNFTNKGKVSKPQRSKFDLVNQKAEELLQARLDIKNNTKADMQRAIALAKIVNNASWDDDFVTIKGKTSHSSWYQHSGELNDVSHYLYQVPAKVANQAKELQAIRRKHQNDDSFDFVATSYLTKEVRIADHDNGR